MPYNAVAQTFAPAGGTFAPFPAVTESYDGRTLAQLTAAGFTAISCTTNTTTLISAGSKRTTGITIVCPIDQQSCALDNATPILGPFFPQTQALIGTVNLTLINVSASGPTFIIPPGSSLFLSPYWDPVYGFPTGPTTSICFLNS